MEPAGAEVLQAAAERFALSTRVVDSILRVARTIADLADYADRVKLSGPGSLVS